MGGGVRGKCETGGKVVKEALPSLCVFCVIAESTPAPLTYGVPQMGYKYTGASADILFFAAKCLASTYDW